MQSTISNASLRRRRESTQSDRMQQSATKTRARTRARHFPPRHSRSLSTSFPHPPSSFLHSPSSFPRRRESPRPGEATAFRFLSQSPRGARTGGKLDVDGNRHNATGCSRVQRKLVRARARGIFPHVIPAPCLRHSHTHPRHSREAFPPTSFPLPVYVIPTLLPSFPRRRESPRLQRIGAPSPRSAAPVSTINHRTEPMRRPV